MSRESKGLNLKNSIAVVDKKSYIRESKKGNSYRIENSRILNNEVKIYCNSLETEPNYFKAFAIEVNKSKVSDVRIEVILTQKKGGKDPLYAVKYAIENRGSCKNTWVVFDKDEFDIEKAIKLARENQVHVAWSNECFELWILLHFRLVEIAIGRKECLIKVKEFLKKEMKLDYTKNNKDIYEKLKSKLRIAIANAKRQHQLIKRDGVLPNRANPCTTVYELVEHLVQRIDEE